MRSKPGVALSAADKAAAADEWAGVLAKLTPALDKLGVKMAVEEHPKSRLQSPDGKGRKLTACSPDPDWLVLTFDGVTPEARMALVGSGAAEPDAYGLEWLYYEGHILECCTFARNLIDMVK